MPATDLDKRKVIGGSLLPVIARAMLEDTDGNPIDLSGIENLENLVFIDGKLSVSSHPYYVDIVKGNVANHQAVNKFGRNTTVGASLEPVWDYSGPYEYLADDVFSPMYLSSDDALDQGMIYEVTGINSEYNYDTVLVATDGSDGQTFVVIPSNAADGEWWRIFRALNTSSTPATGNIYISKDNTDAGGNGIPDDTDDIQAQIKIGFEQTLMALWTVPVGMVAYMTSFYAATSSDKVTEVHLFYRPFGGVFNVEHSLDLAKGANQHPFDFPKVFAAKGDIKIVAAATGGGGVVDGGFDLWFEPV